MAGVLVIAAQVEQAFVGGFLKVESGGISQRQGFEVWRTPASCRLGEFMDSLERFISARAKSIPLLSILSERQAGWGQQKPLSLRLTKTS